MQWYPPLKRENSECRPGWQGRRSVPRAIIRSGLGMSAVAVRGGAGELSASASPAPQHEMRAIAIAPAKVVLVIMISSGALVARAMA